MALTAPTAKARAELKRRKERHFNPEPSNSDYIMSFLSFQRKKGMIYYGP